MLGVAHKKLEGVGAWREVDKGFCLTGAKVQVIFAIRNRLIERRDGYVDEQVVVSGIGKGHPGRRHADVARAEPYFDASCLEGISVIWITNIHICIRGCRCPLVCGGRRTAWLRVAMLRGGRSREQ